MNEESTPVENEKIETSSDEPAEKIASTSEKQSEPDLSDATADDVGTNQNDEAKPEALLAGKFKTVEELAKGYKEAEKFVSKSAEYEKQLQAYKAQEEQAKLTREMQARQEGFETPEEQQISRDVANHEFALFVNALEAGYAGEGYEDALAALQKYQTTGNPSDLVMAKRLFDPQALELIAENRKAFKDQKLDEYHQNQSQQTFLSAKEKLETFAKETGDWLDSEIRQEAVGMAFNAFGGNADFGQIKTLIDKIEADAVKRNETKQKAEQEQKERLEQMQMPSGGNHEKHQENTNWQGVEDEAEMRKIVNKYL